MSAYFNGLLAIAAGLVLSAGWSSLVNQSAQADSAKAAIACCCVAGDCDCPCGGLCCESGDCSLCICDCCETPAE